MSVAGWPVVLASASPRRQELLRRLVPDFTVDAADIDEDALTEPEPWITAQRLAREKVLAVAERHPDSLVIGGDTVVGLEVRPGEWELLGKPVDAEDAERILGRLSGREHVVVTGVCLRYPGGFEAFTEAARVTFRRLSAEEIRAYIAGGEPMDKAGAYGYQGGAKAFIDRIAGDVETVIGLPVERLRESLRGLGYRC